MADTRETVVVKDGDSAGPNVGVIVAIIAVVLIVVFLLFGGAMWNGGSSDSGGGSGDTQIQTQQTPSPNTSQQ